MLIKLSKWSCVEVIREEEVTVWTFTIVPLKGWKSSNIWGQPLRFKILFRKKFKTD
jgi:hypothetical protein